MLSMVPAAVKILTLSGYDQIYHGQVNIEHIHGTLCTGQDSDSTLKSCSTSEKRGTNGVRK
jgi:hypothetical protein